MHSSSSSYVGIQCRHLIMVGNTTMKYSHKVQTIFKCTMPKKNKSSRVVFVLSIQSPVNVLSILFNHTLAWRKNITIKISPPIFIIYYSVERIIFSSINSLQKKLPPPDRHNVKFQTCQCMYQNGLGYLWGVGTVL